MDSPEWPKHIIGNVVALYGLHISRYSLVLLMLLYTLACYFQQWRRKMFSSREAKEWEAI